MPVYKLNRSMRPETLQLRSDLEEEWRGNSHTTSYNAPKIYVTDEHSGTPVEIYVIWTRWEPVPRNERSEIILDVYQTLKGADSIMRVAAAVGMTPTEAVDSNFELDAQS